MEHERSNGNENAENQFASLLEVQGSTSQQRPQIASDLHSRKRPPSETVLKIVSATYGPSEGRRLLTGELSNDIAACIPFTRDVAPFLKALLLTRKPQHEQSEDTEIDEENELGGDDMPDLVRISGRKRSAIPLMDGKQMNSIFGDPCPGTSKRLKIHYVTYESYNDATSRASFASEVHRESFAENERIVLRPRVAFYEDDLTLQQAIAATANKFERTRITEESEDNQNIETLKNARKMGRAQSIAEFVESFSTGELAVPYKTSSPASKPQKKWRLRSATSEVTLPIILPFLTVKERVHCKLVCLVWRHVIRYWGVAKTIDVNDDTTFPNFNAPILRGLLAHSHHSLQSLFLGDFQELTKNDLHPAIPHLRKLNNLDISRCNQLDDSTLLMLSEHVASSLEVLYLKGLRNVTDKGMLSISQSCTNLQVLEISNVPITDDSGISIGENLRKLTALYMRDNYLLTNRSVDVITKKCTQLSQLTLWGCTRLRHLSFDTVDNNVGCGRLVLLNLWGCHSLLDGVANSLGTMRHLRSLVVSECHKLTNTFLFGLAQNVPQLNHIHLRYCKKITDKGISAIADSMQHLFSLDLSFCSRISSRAILNLLEVRQDTLAELRLHSCSHLDVTRDLRHHTEFRGNFSGDGRTGSSILNVLRSNGFRSHLNILDLRNCGGHEAGKGYPNDDAFVQGMAELKFQQSIPGFFQRPTHHAVQID